MKCYICKKIIRTVDAKHCPFCGNKLNMKVTSRRVKYIEVPDENILNRIEQKLDKILKSD